MGPRRRPRSSGSPPAPKAPPVNTATEPVVHVQDSPCSLELSRNAKGIAQWAIKLYGERDNMDEVLDRVLALDARLQKEA